MEVNQPVHPLKAQLLCHDFHVCQLCREVTFAALSVQVAGGTGRQFSGLFCQFQGLCVRPETLQARR
ncbi:hypothetical protein ECZU43_21790 [Escherichia coli]|nr:hypothetical protein ECZU43_21790 [Escherichia coli]